MKKRFKLLVLGIMVVLSFGLVSCGNKAANEENGNTAQGMAPNDYYNYVVGRYDYYFDKDKVDKGYDVYNVYDDDFNYNGNYNDFVVGYNDFYKTDRNNLESFKKDIESNYKKGNAEVDKINDEVMSSIDKSLNAMDQYRNSFEERTKDYGTMAKDEVVKGLRDIGKVPHEARMELDKLIEGAKEKLNID